MEKFIGDFSFSSMKMKRMKMMVKNIEKYKEKTNIFYFR
jgi:hypothetical protein